MGKTIGIASNKTRNSGEFSRSIFSSHQFSAAVNENGIKVRYYRQSQDRIFDRAT